MLWCAIGLKDRIRMPALLCAVRAAEGDVHVGFREGAGECGEGSRGVEVGDEERRVQPRDLNVDAVNRTDAHLASAEALAAYIARRSLRAFECNVNRIGMDRGVVSAYDELIVEPSFFCE